MSDDARAVVLLGAVAAGALHPSRPALLVGAVVVLAGLLGRWALVVALGAALVASGLAQRSLDGLDGLRAEVVAARITVLSDPAPGGGGLRFDARLGGRRVEVRARGSTAGAVRDVLAGEVLDVRGRTRPVDGSAPWLVPRHVAGHLDLLVVNGREDGSAPARLANGLRRTLARGVTHLGERPASLFTGLVIGDDRAQPPDLADDFLGAGLTHLLAVSGQNVAFVLTVVAPVLRRVRLWPRLGLTLAVVLGFALTTRFEPSVLRASAMAALAATMGTAGWPWPRLRILAVASAVLLLADPLLVRSVGFRLSVAAAAAIVLLAPRLEQTLPGPAVVRAPLAVTVAAQIGVAPVLLATFGPIPVASLPANLLAVPVAGLVMVWGLTGGVLAGIVDGALRTGLHAPTALALEWLQVVAHRAARAPMGSLEAVHVLALSGGLLLATAPLGAWRSVGRAVAALAVVAAGVGAHAPPPLRTEVAPGVVRWAGGGAEVVVLRGGGRAGGPRPDAVLDGLRRAGIASIDALVVADDRVDPELVGLVARGRSVGVVLARDLDPALALRVERPPPGRTILELGGLEVRLEVLPQRIVVDAVPRRRAGGSG